MEYLKDTCIFIKYLNSGSKIIGAASHLRSAECKLSVTDKVHNEMTPGPHVPKENAETAQEIYNTINMCINSNIVGLHKVADDNRYQENLKDIREKYYGKPNRSMLERAKRKGISKSELVNNIKKKDMGECSCIAIAMEHDDMTIVTNDKGRVYMREDIKLFEIYSEKHGIKVLNYDEWLCESGYCE